MADRSRGYSVKKMYFKCLVSFTAAMLACVIGCGGDQIISLSQDSIRVDSNKSIFLRFEKGESRLLDSIRLKEFCLKENLKSNIEGCGDSDIGYDSEIGPGDLFKISLPTNDSGDLLMVVESRNWIQDRADALILFSKRNNNLKNCKVEDVRTIGFFFTPIIQCPPLRLSGGKAPIITFSPTNVSYEDVGWSLQSLWLVITLVPNLGGHSFYLRVSLEQ